MIYKIINNTSSQFNIHQDNCICKHIEEKQTYIFSYDMWSLIDINDCLITSTDKLFKQSNNINYLINYSTRNLNTIDNQLTTIIINSTF